MTEPTKESPLPSQLTGLIQQHLSQTLTEEFVSKMVEQRVHDLIKQSLDEAMGRYNDLGKMLREALTQSLKVVKLDLPSYGSIISNILKERISESVSDLVKARLEQDLNELLHLAPDAIKLSELAKTLVDESYNDDHHSRIITVVLDTSRSYATYLYLDEDHHYSDMDAKDRARFSLVIGEDGRISSFTDRQQGGYKHVGTKYGLARKLEAYYACATVIDLDIDEVVLSKSGEDY